MKGSSSDSDSSAPYNPNGHYDQPTSYQPPQGIPFQDRKQGKTYILNRFCKECSAMLDERWKVCPCCETKVESVVRADDLKPKKCSCGRTITDDYRFCPGCAKPIDESWKDRLVCKCGVVYADNAKYCIGCGSGIHCSPHKPLAGTTARTRKLRNTKQ